MWAIGNDVADKKGFSLVELLIAIGLMSVISAGIVSLIGQGPRQTARDGRRQADLADAGERRGNASGSFAPTARLTAGSVGRGETIILVDDVYTSGATLNEAAKTLKNAGYAAVYGMTVLRG